MSTLQGVDVDRRAIASAGKDAVLIFPHVGNLADQPHAATGQRDGEEQCRKIDHHAVPIVVVLLSALVFLEALDRRGRRPRGVQRPGPATIARAVPPLPERYDPVVIIGGFGVV